MGKFSYNVIEITNMSASSVGYCTVKLVLELSGNVKGTGSMRFNDLMEPCYDSMHFFPSLSDRRMSKTQTC